VTQASVPHVDWGHAVDAELGIHAAPALLVAPGYERHLLPGGLTVLVVEDAAALPAALRVLSDSMLDPFVAIDLEWRPETGRRFTPVAMLQLATARTALLVRTCRTGFRLPPPLRAFLARPDVTLVGFSWSGSDEPKMQATFGVGRADFGRFLDLQSVAAGLGYHGIGLGRLAGAVLRTPLHKHRSVTMSNWEAARLSRGQVKYAALDVLITGAVLRALRLWHASPSPCEGCGALLGGAITGADFACGCGRVFGEVRAYLRHCERTGHELQWAECDACGCTRALPWPTSGVGGGGADSAAAAAQHGGRGGGAAAGTALV
jgi:3'-5' exonuclease